MRGMPPSSSTMASSLQQVGLCGVGGVREGSGVMVGWVG